MPTPSLTTFTSHLSTPRLLAALHPHRWTPHYLTFLNIHIHRRSYTPPSSLTAKLSRLHSIFRNPDPYIHQAQQILDTGHESRWAHCIMTLTSHTILSYAFLHELLFFISSPLLGVDTIEVIQDEPYQKLYGYKAPLRTRCPLHLRFRNTTAEFFATGFLQSVISERPLVAIVDLWGVKHREAAVVAHILALAQQHFGDAEVDGEEPEFLVIAITYRPKTAEEMASDGGVWMVGYPHTPVYTFYRSQVTNQYLDSVDAQVPEKLVVETSEGFDVGVPGRKEEFAECLVGLVAGLAEREEKARRVVGEVRERRKERWKAESGEVEGVMRKVKRKRREADDGGCERRVRM
ncbi:hypothetical protein K440DRAFT_663707 [Wilcoxina mikolae CBS 423.85]|nr:hypothetical protein K440DRAFT_663707 [Wilcoxina mikolae CBS 423.85]